MTVISSCYASDIAKVSVVKLNKDDAIKMLANNCANRPIRKQYVDRYRRDMNEGKWMFNGDSIVLDSEGRLKGGQHRLTSFATSNLDELVVVIVQLIKTDDILPTLNTGNGMSASQMLQINGYEGARSLASCAKWLKSIMDNDNNRSNPFYYTNSEILEFVNKYKDSIYPYINKGHNNHSGLTATFAAVFAFVEITIPSISSDLRSIAKDAIDCVGERGSIAHACIKMKELDHGFGRGGQVNMLHKEMSIIANWVLDGKVKDRVYEISTADFKKSIIAASFRAGGQPLRASKENK